MRKPTNVPRVAPPKKQAIVTEASVRLLDKTSARPVKKGAKPEQSVEALASGRSKRYTLSIGELAHELLQELTRRTHRPMSNIVHALVTDRDIGELAAVILKANPVANRGRARKYYHQK